MTYNSRQWRLTPIVLITFSVLQAAFASVLRIWECSVHPRLQLTRQLLLCAVPVFRGEGKFSAEVSHRDEDLWSLVSVKTFFRYILLL